MLTQEQQLKIRMQKANLPTLFEGQIEKASGILFPQINSSDIIKMWIAGEEDTRTETAIAILRICAESQPVKYINMLKIMNMSFENLHEAFDTLDKFKGVLLLDNISRNPPPLFRSKLYALLISRHYDNLSTICTSDIEPTDLFAIYGVEISQHILFKYKFFKTRESV